MTARSFIIGLILLIIVGVTIAYTDRAAHSWHTSAVSSSG